MANRKLYVAYGSNLYMAQMKARCPEAKAIGTSYIKDYELLFKGSKTGSYLTIEKKKDSRVPVGVWEVSENDEKNLDMYEGYPTFYYKKEMKLPIKRFGCDKVKWEKVFVYIMHENFLLGIPHQYYIDVCVTGYHDFGFEDLSPLKDALKKNVDNLVGKCLGSESMDDVEYKEA